MRYTKYFSGVLKNQGVPNLNVEQYARLMNIVSLEGGLQGLQDLKGSILSQEDKQAVLWKDGQFLDNHITEKEKCNCYAIENSLSTLFIMLNITP